MPLLRLALFCTLLLFGFLGSFVLGLPFPGSPDSRLAWLRMRLCRAACRILGLRIVRDGAPPAAGPALLVGNHVSWTDILALGAVAPVFFVARHDLVDWPGVGAIARLHGTLFLERGRRQKIPGVNRAIAERMGQGGLVVLFPEATTNDGSRLLKFHAAHFAAARDLLRAAPALEAVRIAPFALAYARRRGLPLGRAGRADIAWYGETTLFPHLMQLLRHGGAECRLVFSPELAFTRASDRKKVARAAHATVKDEFTVMIAGGTRVPLAAGGV